MSAGGSIPEPLIRRSAATIIISTAETIIARKYLSILVNPRLRQTVPAV